MSVFAALFWTVLLIALAIAIFKHIGTLIKIVILVVVALFVLTMIFSISTIGNLFMDLLGIVLIAIGVIWLRLLKK